MKITFDDALLIAQILKNEDVCQEVFFYMDELAMTPMEALTTVGIYSKDIKRIYPQFQRI